MPTLDELHAIGSILRGAARPRRSRSCPSHCPRPRYVPLVSVDDHLIEPPHLFEGRLPRRFEASGPRASSATTTASTTGCSRRIGCRCSGPTRSRVGDPGMGYLGPVNFGELNPGVWDIHERVRHMDINGVAASLNFPSAPFGFAGQRFLRMQDAELGLASMRAFNDWILEEWAGTYPGRIIPCQVAWLRDPEIAATEIRRNAERGASRRCRSPRIRTSSACRRSTGYWEPAPSGLRGDRHGRQPPRRLVVGAFAGAASDPPDTVGVPSSP